MDSFSPERWQWYEEKCRAEQLAWLRDLSIAESLAIYADMHRLAMSQQDDSAGTRRLEQRRFEEKAARWQKLRAVFLKWDQLRAERESSPHIDRSGRVASS